MQYLLQKTGFAPYSYGTNTLKADAYSPFA